jgi:DNA-binding transcriptional ArsR family regulator
MIVYCAREMHGMMGLSRNAFLGLCVSEVVEKHGEWIASNEQTWCVFTHHLSTLVDWKLVQVEEMRRWLGLAQRFRRASARLEQSN